MAVSPGYLAGRSYSSCRRKKRSSLDPCMIKRRPMLRYWTLGTIVQECPYSSRGAKVSNRLPAAE
jgi:hypothetical protein